MKERLRFPMYDTNFLGAGAVANGTTLIFFSVPQGGVFGAGIKTELQTNLTTSGQMPYKVFRAVGIRLNMYSTTAIPVLIGDVNQILNNAVVQWKKEDRIILELPCHWIPSGIGLSGQSSAGATDFATNGLPVLSNIYRVLPETYTTGDRIQLKITFRNGITVATVGGVNVEVMLEGITDKKF